MHFSTLVSVAMLGISAIGVTAAPVMVVDSSDLVERDDPCDDKATPTSAGVSAGSGAGKNSGKGAGNAKSGAGAGASSSASSSNSTAGAGDDAGAGADAASSTATANAAEKTRACDMGDQSLAAGLQASVAIGIGQQASVTTLQGILGDGSKVNQDDFQTAVQRLQQFTDTAASQLTTATGIADDDSFAQTQLKLLATSQKQQAAQIKTLNGTAADVATLKQLATSFVTSTNNAQAGAANALIDCNIPANAVSG